MSQASTARTASPPALAAAPAAAPAASEAAEIAPTFHASNAMAATSPALAARLSAPRATPGTALPPASAAPRIDAAAAAHDPGAPVSAQAAAATQSDPTSPLASTSAVFASSGNIRSEIAFDARLAEPRKATQAAAIHAGDAASAQATLAPNLAAPQITPAPNAVPVATLDARVGDHGWNQGLGDKLVWMAGQGHQVAELHLNPPDLGPLKITLTLNHDQASAQFISAHTHVRDAIQAAMPRLREMLAGSGITLGNANVSTGTFGGQPQPQHAPHAYPTPLAPAAAPSGGIARAARPLQRSPGRVDTFA